MGKSLIERKPIDFGQDYTARQLAILSEEVPIAEIRTTELAAIIRKANERADAMSYDIACGLRHYKLHPNDYVPVYSKGEAKAILQRLTPWAIDWATDDE